MTQETRERRPDVVGGTAPGEAGEPLSTLPRTSDQVFVARHGEVENEVAAAYLDGLETGVRLASEAMTRALREAVAGPHSYGLSGREESAADIVRRLARVMTVKP